MESKQTTLEQRRERGDLIQIYNLLNKIDVIDNEADSLPPDMHCSLYVDDFSISYSSPRLDDVERHIQLALNRVTRWAGSHGFRFSPVDHALFPGEGRFP